MQYDSENDMKNDMPKDGESPLSTYFAIKPGKELADIVLGKSETFYNILNRNNYLNKIRKMWRYYYGIFGDVSGDHQINFTGEQGELVTLPVNHFRNLAQHIYTMITANRPVMEARAINTDYKSLSQTYLANGILDYYMREKGLENALKHACEMSIVMGAGFIKMDWNATAGEAYDADPDTNKMDYEGEIEFTVLSPLDVVTDGTREKWDNEWVCVRTFKNKYNLMAKYPEFADKIQGLPTKSQMSSYYSLSIWSNDNTDDIPVYEFYHGKTEAIPEGRYMLFLSSDVVCIDMPLPYRVVPIFRVAPNNILGTPYGYSPMFDVFPLQEGINALYSTIMTNQNAFGVQNLWMPKGADISYSSLEGGLNVIESSVKPEAINLTQTPAEIFKFSDMLIQAAETISGVNSVARGNPEPSLKSGNALALIQSMAIQFVSGLQQSYVQLIEQTGTSLIQILKDFALTPKIVALVGKNNKTFLKEFTGEDLHSINRVIVDMGNPLSHCLAKDTLVLMYDGTTKVVQDIKIGEQIMGPDSYPRTIKNTSSGEEIMYEITSKDSNRGIKYGCNENHILTLKYCSDDYRYDVKKGDILDITVKEYLKLPNRHKRLLQGFTTGVEFESKQLPIPAYILGSWLGDGNSRNTSITTMDQEMVDVWQNYADSIGMQIRIEENKQPNRSKNYYITSGEMYGKPDRNSFKNALNELELINNKHIPFVYLTSNREDRLNLLAGLLDTDGTRIDETFIFIQKNDVLTKNVIYLAKSLGFRVTTKKRLSYSGPIMDQEQREIINEHNVVSIGGNTWEIPTKLPRKQCKYKEKARNPLNYGINIESKGIGTYYGFTLTEEPHFLLGDFTVTHNTIAGRVQMADNLLQYQLIKDPLQYFMVLNTGRLDATFEGEMSELLLIKAENERMMDGEQVQAVALDKHSQHIKEHKNVLADPDLRKETDLVQNVLAHIQQHIQLLQTTEPSLLQMIGEQPLPPPQPPGAQPPNTQGPPQGAGPMPGPAEPPKGAIHKNKIPGVVGAQAGMAQPGESIQGPNQERNNLPHIAKPPKPFNNLPTNAKNVPQ